MIADAVTVDMFAGLGCWLEVEFAGSAVRYAWAGGPVVSVIIGGKERTTVPARTVVTLGDVVRVCVDDWRTWGGKVSRLPRAGAASVRVRLVWPSAHVVEMETAAA